MVRRRRFTPRFKAQVALEALREERRVQQIAAETEMQTPHGKIGQLVPAPKPLILAGTIHQSSF